MVKFILLFAFPVCAYSGPLAITGGYFGFALSEIVSWSFVGDGFFAQGRNDPGTNHCGFCFAPFQLVNPVFSSVAAQNGDIYFGGKSYALPSVGFTGRFPFGVGSVFLNPQAPLPTVTGAGTWDIPFNVGGSFCVTDNPLVAPPTPPDPGCFSAIGTAIAHYRVLATGTPNAFYQPEPTVDIVSPGILDFATPEPGTLGAGMLVMLLMSAAKCRTKVLNTGRVEPTVRVAP